MPVSKLHVISTGDECVCLGYGHIAPKTPVGKIVTIFYAILGIPITVICWSNIGDAMANAFRDMYR